MKRSIDRIVADMEKYRRVNDDDLQTVIDALKPAPSPEITLEDLADTMTNLITSVKSCGNVFEDLGLPNADRLLEKSGQIHEGKGQSPLPNGCTLYWKTNEVGGRTYSSDEIGCAVHVWDTALVDHGTLLAAMTKELELQTFERHISEKRRK